MTVVRRWGLVEKPNENGRWPAMYNLITSHAALDDEPFFLVMYRRFKGPSPSDSTLKVYL